MLLVKKAARLLILVFILSIMIFVITRIMPLSPMEVLLSTYQLPATEENISILTSKWGLDRPVYFQYWSWISNFAKGDWGYSIVSGEPIRDEILKRLPYSITLGLGGILLASLLSFWLGYLAAVKRRFWDFLSRFIAISNQVIPVFIVSIYIIYIVSVKYSLIKIFTGNDVYPLMIGVLLMALYYTGDLSRVVRVHFMDLMNEPYILRLYSYGFSRNKLLLKHGYKPVLYGLNSALISKFATILGGSAVIEFCFAIPGISFFMIESITKRDYYVIQSYLLIIVLWMIFVHFIFELLESVLRRR